MRCRVLLPTGKQALTYVKVHSSFEGGGGGAEEWRRETPWSCWEKGVIILS